MTSDCLTIEDYLPFRWQKVDVSEIDELSHSLQMQSSTVIKSILSFEHLPTEPRDDSHELASDLQRLDVKINLLLEMVGQLLATGQTTPERHQIKLNINGVTWHCTGDVPNDGDVVHVEIYPSTGLPKPISLMGMVSSVKKHQQVTSVTIIFLELQQGFRDDLERMIFLHHRRLIAQQRQH